jgi:cytidylate kinase
MPPLLYIITGAMASGKSTVAKALVQHFEKSAYVSGDAFLRMIVKGGASYGPVLDKDARKELTLRQDIAMEVVRRYHLSGFTVVYEDILIGDDLVRVTEVLADLAARVVVLNPSAEELARRDAAREKTGYRSGFSPTVLADALSRDTPRIGLWIDSTEMTVESVVEAILGHAW